MFGVLGVLMQNLPNLCFSIMLNSEKHLLMHDYHLRAHEYYDYYESIILSYIKEIKMEDIKLFYELFIDDEKVYTMGEKDFSKFIKRVNRHLTSEDRYKILEFIIGDNDEK